MKITDVKVWQVEGIAYNWTLLKIYTDEGITGVGESTNWPGSPVIKAATCHLAEKIIGLDPMRTDYIWTKLYRDMNWIGPGGPALCAISGIEMALLDLKGKKLGVPMYELLGGAFRKEIRLYANYWFTKCSHTPEGYSKAAREVMNEGFRGLKFDPFAHTDYLYGDLKSSQSMEKSAMDHSYEIVKAVRDAIGPDADMMIETHALLDYKSAVEMSRRLSEFGVTWYEEPVGPENIDSLEAARKRIDPSIPICVGERLYTRHGIRQVLERQICDIIMPDITRCGGPGELKKMASMAEIYNVMIAPHNPNGPLSTLASAHVCACIPNFFRQEYMYLDVPWRDSVITNPLKIKDGSLILSDEPGLGVDLVEEEILKHPEITDATTVKDRKFYV